MKSLFQIAVLFVLVAMASCGGKVTKKAVKTGENLKASIEDFEKNRQKFSTMVTKSVENANTALADENTNVQDVAVDFEKDWNDIQNRYDKMLKDFEDVGKNSQAYFDQLNDLANRINNEKLKQAEMEKNLDLLNRWQKHYDEANSSIEQVKKVLQDGNDFHMVLVGSSVRQKLETNVEELQKISERAKTLLLDLEAFTQAGRELVKG